VVDATHIKSEAVDVKSSAPVPVCCVTLLWITPDENTGTAVNVETPVTANFPLEVISPWTFKCPLALIEPCTTKASPLSLLVPIATFPPWKYDNPFPLILFFTELFW